MDKRDKLNSIYIVVFLPLLAVITAGTALVLFVLNETAMAIVMLCVAAASFGLIISRHLKYVRYIKHKAASSETAERFRAEMAETHVAELESVVAELERSSRVIQESREKFRHAALHDSLTGLANRNKFVELIAEQLESDDRKFCLFYLDLNRFKTVNDSLGHTVGDELIQEVAKRLVEIAGSNGVIGRFSGDEFAFLSYGTGRVREAEELAAHVCRRLSLPFDVNGRQLFTTVSIGIAINDERYSGAEELLRDADLAMYHAKETSREYVVFDKIMHARAVSLLELETDLRFALARGEFELYYQPLVDLDDVSLMGFEALVRWNHPNRGLVTPDDFIAVAEATGLIIPMTSVLLRSACVQLKKWQDAGVVGAATVISVNLSTGFLTQSGVVDQIRTIIFESNVDPECLKLEITESAVMENAEATIAVLDKIRELGVRISIDDFGTGYSNLSYLHKFPINSLKIDRSFVSTMEAGAENGEIVRTVIALAKALGLSVIAEGIESIHQFHQLRILGCEFGQGYLFSRPLPVVDIERLLSDRNRWRNILPNIEVGAVARNRELTHLRIH